VRINCNRSIEFKLYNKVVERILVEKEERKDEMEIGQYRIVCQIQDYASLGVLSVIEKLPRLEKT
jgi:hypothetical protein